MYVQNFNEIAFDTKTCDLDNSILILNMKICFVCFKQFALTLQVESWFSFFLSTCQTCHASFSGSVGDRRFNINGQQLLYQLWYNLFFCGTVYRAVAPETGFEFSDQHFKHNIMYCEILKDKKRSMLAQFKVVQEQSVHPFLFFAILSELPFL